MQYALFQDIKDRASVDTNPARSGGHSKTVAAKFRPSAAMEAGLGGFGTTIGESGNRYVFSKTTVEQAMLYRKAVFAVGDMCGGKMQVSVDALSLWSDGIPEGADIFVHILDAKEDCRSVLKDIGAA